MCSRQKAVPLRKISDFSRFFGDFYENERFSREEIRPTLCSTSAFKTVYVYAYAYAYAYVYVYLEFCNSGNSRIRILVFWNSGTPQMVHYEGLLCVPLLSSKRSIWGVQEFKNPGILDSGILEFLNS